MTQKCKTCGAKVTLETRYCPYCKSELEGYKWEPLTPKGEKLAILEFIVWVTLVIYFIGFSFWRIATFSNWKVMPGGENTIVLSFILFLFLIIYLLFNRVVNKIIWKKKLYKKTPVPKFAPSDKVLDEIRFVEVPFLNYAYNIFFTKEYIIFCYLDKFYIPPYWSTIKNLWLKKRLKKEAEELKLLKSDLSKLASYNGNNFYISYKDVKKIILRKNGVKIVLFSKHPLTKTTNIVLTDFFITGLKLKSKNFRKVFKKYFPNLIEEEDGRFTELELWFSDF